MKCARLSYMLRGGGLYCLMRSLSAAGARTTRALLSRQSNVRWPSPNALCQQFRNALGLEIHAAVRRVLDFVRHEDHVPVDLITPEWIGGKSCP